jgi:hypothetical protein
MTALFEPGLGTLEALRREFGRRMPPHLRAVARGATTKLFDGNAGDGSNSLVALAGRIVELRSTLHADETTIDRVAKDYLIAYLQFTHSTAADPAASSLAHVATALLAAWNEADA